MSLDKFGYSFPNGFSNTPFDTEKTITRKRKRDVYEEQNDYDFSTEEADETDEKALKRRKISQQSLLFVEVGRITTNATRAHNRLWMNKKDVKQLFSIEGTLRNMNLDVPRYVKVANCIYRIAIPNSADAIQRDRIALGPLQMDDAKSAIVNSSNNPSTIITPCYINQATQEKLQKVTLSVTPEQWTRKGSLKAN